MNTLSLFDRVVITLLLLSTQATNLKAGNVQVFEALVAMLLPYLVLRHRGRITPEALIMFGPIVFFFFFTSFYAALAIEFFPPSQMSPLKQPLVISLVRLVQYSFIFFAFNHLWISLDRASLMSWAARRYVDVSYWIALLTVLSFALSRATGRILPLVYDTASYIAGEGEAFGRLRARGLFVEGGPYGLSLVASVVLAAVLWRRGEKVALHKMSVLALALFFSQSKAALLCILFLVGMYTIRNLRVRTIIVLLIVSTSAVAGAIRFKWSMIDDFKGYYVAIQAIAEGSVDADPEDGNSTLGRVAGFFIAPRMAADNPLFGVGLGNYSLTRNNPQYLGPMPHVDKWDLPGLGIGTLILEGGLVGLSILFLSYWLFYRRTLGRNSRFDLGFLFLSPLLLQICGVQFYFAYHWLFLLLLVGLLTYPPVLAPERLSQPVTLPTR